MKDVTIIIPIKEYEPSLDKFLDRAIKSCGDNNIILIGKGVENYNFNQNSDEKNNASIKKIKNTSENLTYQHNVNIAVDEVTTKYFSVLEYDDFYSKKWFDNVEKYIEYDVNDISVFLPLTEVVEYNKDNEDSLNTIGYSNEAFWASSFSDEIGYLDIESIQNYLGFNMSGAVLKKDDFISNGKLKESMKLVFWFEYILRSLHEGKQMFVIPKVGYYHFVGREGSLTEDYKNAMTEKEADWWVDLATKEYFFKKDRNKMYQE